LARPVCTKHKRHMQKTNLGTTFSLKTVYDNYAIDVVSYHILLILVTRALRMAGQWRGCPPTKILRWVTYGERAE